MPKGIYKRTKEHIRKRDETRRKNGWWKDPDKTRKKISKTKKGYKQTKEHTRKMREALKGKKKGPMTEKHKRHIGESVKGDKNSAWIDGRSFEPYPIDWTETLKRAIRERDHYICQLTGQYGNCVHHIDYDKKNCDPKNLITLSNSSNSKVNTNREYWTKYFQDLIKLKYQ